MRNALPWVSPSNREWSRFFGVIDERLDIELVATLADADPQWQVVMVGPVVKIDPTQLPQRANLHWLGQQPYELLPQLVAGWDVCLMPFALNESTRYISPTKTLEYMAAGKPVISTAVHDVQAMFSDVVTIAADVDAFVDDCRAALAEPAQRRRARNAEMQATVRRYSWDETAATVHRALEEVIATAAWAPPRAGGLPLVVTEPPVAADSFETTVGEPESRAGSTRLIRASAA